MIATVSAGFAVARPLSQDSLHTSQTKTASAGKAATAAAATQAKKAQQPINADPVAPEQPKWPNMKPSGEQQQQLLASDGACLLLFMQSLDAARLRPRLSHSTSIINSSYHWLTFQNKRHLYQACLYEVVSQVVSHAAQLLTAHPLGMCPTRFTPPCRLLPLQDTIMSVVCCC